MKVTATALPEVLILEPRVFGDERGFFLESFNQRAFDEAVGRPVAFVQDNHSRSARGVLRGLHYQLPPHEQGKLVRVVAGRVFDVAVDIRRDSPTFGRWAGVELSGREPPPAVDPARIRARLPGAQRQRRLPLQDHRLLRAAGRGRGALGRSGHRDRLAGRRGPAGAVAQGRGSAGAARCAGLRGRVGTPAGIIGRP